MATTGNNPIHNPRPIQVEEVDEDDISAQEELNQFICDRYENVDGESDLDDFFDDLEDEIDAFEMEAKLDPTALQRAKGECLWVGFDAEWVYDEARDENIILSIQLYVPPQPAVRMVRDNTPRADRLSRIVFASSPTREGRPQLTSALRQIVDTAIEQNLIESEPRLIYVVGFGLRFDLAALSDFSQLKRQIDSVSGHVATVKGHAQLEFPRSVVTGDGLEPVQIGLHFIDVAAHVPPGKALRDVGQLIQLPKLDIPAPYSIERMDEYLRLDPDGFHQYAMRDAEIAVRYAMELADFAMREFGIKTLPATASGLALRWCLQTLKEAEIDRLEAFGLQKTVKDVYHSATNRRRTFKDEEPTTMRRIQEALTVETYAGGRNESMWLGPTPVGRWFDYDLAGAYSTGLMDLQQIDFDKPKASLDATEYLGHVAGYALIEFEHQPDTRFPVFAISRGGKGLVFPLKGTTFATAPEIQAAHDLKCHIVIKWGIVYPWRQPLPGQDLSQSQSRTLLFQPFVKAARQLRNKLKVELKKVNAQRKAEGLEEIESLKEQAAKLYANATYGKLCQSLRSKNVFDTRKVQSTKLKPSPITNAAYGAHTTGLIRAILAELLNRIPSHRTVLSVTTDGFLTDTTETEIESCLQGPLCQRFQKLCDEIAPGTQMLEIKHEVAQLVCMKTRGQLTGKALKDKKIVLAKAGIQPVIEAPADLPAEQYKALQNEKMLNLYLNRRPGKKVLRYQFPSIRDQWTLGVDLHKYDRRVTMSLEVDFKRQLIDPQMIAVDGRNARHLAMNTKPWVTIEQFDMARAKMDQWRRENCLKTLKDWDSLKMELLIQANKVKQRAKGQTTMNIRKGKDEADLLRRAFLRAYTHDALGLTRTLAYDALAQWLTSIGYATTEKEIISSRSQKLALHVVPPTEVAMRLWKQLQNKFPDADLDPLLPEDWVNTPLAQ